jgi:hypothetical protein
MNCDKAFTFARAVMMQDSLEQLAAREVPRVRTIIDLQGQRREEPIAATIDDWVAQMQALLRDVELGQTYVYFDGHVIPSDANGIRVKGIRRSHDLAHVPQVLALKEPQAEAVLHDIGYWTAEDRH